MRQTWRDKVDVPDGFAHVLVDGVIGILVPTSVADEKAKASEQHREQEEARRLNDRLHREKVILDARRDEERGQKAKARLQQKKLSGPPRPGWYRVLPSLADLVRETTGPGATDRSADKEINERRKRIVQQLVDRGPDRLLAMAKDWRQSVDELESALPHFRQPIRSLRNALALAEATGTPPRIAPQLLLGPPGVGKTFYSNRVAELLGTTRASVQFDQPGAGAQLRGSDKYWANSEPGLLFNQICLGDVANPVVLLDEVDKACVGSHRNALDSLAQLHGALERETARCIRDVSVDVEFDASLVTYIATANSLQGIGAPIVSRMEVSVIEPPNKWEAIDIAQSIVHGVLQKLKLDGQVRFERSALVVLAHLSPRRMLRAAEQAVAAAVVAGRARVGEDEMWAELSGGGDPRLH